MKRKIAFLMLAALASMACLSAQNRIPGVSTGYKGMLETGMTFYEGKSEFTTFDISTTHGFQINPHIFVGAGLGYSGDEEGDYHMLPLYGAFRGNIPVGNKFFPFAGARLGYSLDGWDGLYFNPNVGCTYLFNHRLGIDLSLGYTLQQVQLSGSILGFNFNTKTSLNAFTFRLGIQF